MPRAELVTVGELGLVPLDHTPVQPVVRFVAAYERRASGIGSHWSSEEWEPVPTKHTTAVSLLDPLLNHSGTVTT